MVLLFNAGVEIHVFYQLVIILFLPFLVRISSLLLPHKTTSLLSPNHKRSSRLLSRRRLRHLTH